MRSSVLGTIAAVLCIGQCLLLPIAWAQDADKQGVESTISVRKSEGDLVQAHKEEMHAVKEAYIASLGNADVSGDAVTDNSKAASAGSGPKFGSGFEGFEGIWPDSYWFVGDSNSASGSVYWDDENCWVDEGSWSAWCASTNAPAGDCNVYANDMDAYMYVECDYLGLSGSGTNHFYFDLWSQVEDTFDYLEIRVQGYVSNPGHGVVGTPDASGSLFYEDTTGWETKDITLGAAFDPCFFVRIYFIFHSDNSVTDDGAYLDEIYLSALTDTELYPYSGGFPSAPTTGCLRVRIKPSLVRLYGAQWRVDGGIWRNHNALVCNLSAGYHTVQFKRVPGWIRPGGTAVLIVGGSTTTLIGRYF